MDGCTRRDASRGVFLRRLNTDDFASETEKHPQQIGDWGSFARCKTPSATASRDVSRKGNSLGTHRVPGHTPSPREVNYHATAQINVLVCHHTEATAESPVFYFSILSPAFRQSARKANEKAQILSENLTKFALTLRVICGTIRNIRQHFQELVPSIDKGRHGFSGLKPHRASFSSLAG